jgi:hypothetical protein
MKIFQFLANAITELLQQWLKKNGDSLKVARNRHYECSK